MSRPVPLCERTDPSSRARFSFWVLTRHATEFARQAARIAIAASIVLAIAALEARAYAASAKFECMRAAELSGLPSFGQLESAFTSDGRVISVFDQYLGPSGQAAGSGRQEKHRVQLTWLDGQGRLIKGSSFDLITSGQNENGVDVQSWAYVHPLAHGDALLFTWDQTIHMVDQAGVVAPFARFPSNSSSTALSERGPRGSLKVNENLVFVYGLTEVPMLIELDKKRAKFVSGFHYDRLGPILGAGRTSDGAIVAATKRGILRVDPGGRVEGLFQAPGSGAGRTYSWERHGSFLFAPDAGPDFIGGTPFTDDGEGLIAGSSSGLQILVEPNGHLNVVLRPGDLDLKYNSLEQAGIVPLPPDALAGIRDGKLIVAGFDGKKTETQIEGGPLVESIGARLADGRILSAQYSPEAPSQHQNEKLQETRLWTLTRDGQATPLEPPPGRGLYGFLSDVHRLPSRDTVLNLHDSGRNDWLLIAAGAQTSVRMPVPIGSSPYAFSLTRQGQLAAVDALLRVLVSSNVPISSASVQAPAGGPLTPDARNPRVLQWRVSHECADALAAFNPRVQFLYDGSGALPEATGPVSISTPGPGVALVEARLVFARKGKYTVELLVDSPIEGPAVKLGPSVAGTIDWNLVDYLGEYSRIVAAIAAIGTPLGYAFLWLSLFALAPTSRHARRSLVNAPFLQRGTALLASHFPAVVLRLLRPYYSTLTNEVSEVRAKRGNAFVPIPIQVVASGGSKTDAAVAQVAPSALLSLLAARGHVWLQGASGMGKTCLFDFIQEEYAGKNGLRDAWRSFQFIAVFATAREFSETSPHATPPNAWFRQIMVRELGPSLGVDAESPVIDALLSSGALAFIIDGVNEVDRDESVIVFANDHPQVRVFASSQVLPSAIAESPSMFSQLSMPKDLSDYAHLLLSSMLGKSAALELRSGLQASGLWQELVSGYDIELVAELHQAHGEQPADRLGLYKLVVESACTRLGVDRLIFDLMDESWRLWVNGERFLKPGASLDESELDRLAVQRPRLLNKKSGNQFQFRHDAMRAYLAARRLAAMSDNMDGTEKALENAQWTGRSRESQSDFWAFYVTLIEDSALIQRLFSFAVARPSLQGLQGEILRQHPNAHPGLEFEED